MEHGRWSGAWRMAVLPVCLVLAVLSPAFARPVSAAPDWMSAETAARLDLGFDVLVPTWVPEPFGGEPRVLASEGYYDLYWAIFGGDPTFLRITGTVGGDIPDYSEYDRNVELTVNASVQGNDAYHDVTPIYDEVWWQVNGVVYSVKSRGMTGTDTLSLANALQVLEPSGGGGIVEASLAVPATVGSGEVASIVVDGAEGATLTADAGTFEETGGLTYPGAGTGVFDWRAPSVEADLVVRFALNDPETGAELASAQTTVVAAVTAPEPEPEPEPQFSLSCPTGVTAGEAVPLTVYGAGEVGIDASAGIFPAEAPNTDFAPSAAGGARLYGTIPAEGAAALVWSAPDVGEALAVAIAATGADGGGAACEILVEPVPAEVEATEPSPPTEPSRPTGTIAPPAESSASAPEPTDTVDPTTEPAAAGPTPAETDPVAGPTAAPGTGEDVGAPPNDPPSTVAPTGAAVVTPGAAVVTTPARRTATAAPRPRYPNSDGSGGPADPNYIGEPGLGTLKGRSGGPDTLDGSQPAGSATVAATAPSLPAVPATVQPSPSGTATRATAPATRLPVATLPATATARRTSTVTPAPPTPSATPSPTARAAAVLEPVVREIGSAGGHVSHPAGATLVVPPGTLADGSTVALASVPDPSLPVSAATDLIPGTAFDVTVVGADGEVIDALSGDTVLRLEIPERDRRAGLVVVWVDGDELKPMDGSRLADGSVTAPLPHLSRFVAGVPAEEGRLSGALPWLIAGAVALAGLAGGAVRAATAHRRSAVALPGGRGDGRHAR
jgi:hypothetical protein